MSSAYTSSGKRISSMTHARRGHLCDLCGRTVYGNGGAVAHGRGHVRRGEAVELVKDFGTYPPTSGRVFFAPGDEHIAQFSNNGYRPVVSS